MDLFSIHFFGKSIFLPEKKQLKKRKKLQSAIESLNIRLFDHLDFVFSCDISASTPLPRIKRLPRWCSTSENNQLFRSGKRKRRMRPPPDRRVITFRLLGKPSAGPSPPTGTSRSEPGRDSGTSSDIPPQFRGESCPHALIRGGKAGFQIYNRQQMLSKLFSYEYHNFLYKTF